MLRIKQKNCRFKIDPAKRTVVCWIEGSSVRLMVENFLKDHNIDIFGMRPDINGLRELENIVFMPRKITGVATCAADDVWNEELGKLIAFHKMKTKLNRLFFKHVQSCTNYIDRVMDNMINAAEAYGMRSEAESNRRMVAIEAELDRNSRPEE